MFYSPIVMILLQYSSELRWAMTTSVRPGIPCSEPGDRALLISFGAVVERRGRLVEEKHVGLPVERTGDADALALSARGRPHSPTWVSIPSPAR